MVIGSDLFLDRNLVCVKYGGNYDARVRCTVVVDLRSTIHYDNAARKHVAPNFTLLVAVVVNKYNLVDQKNNPMKKPFVHELSETHDRDRTSSATE